MSHPKLVLNSFEKALKTLEAALEISEVNDIVRDATIQRFEYTYDAAWKMIRRHLVWMGDTEVQSLTREDLFRRAADVGLIERAEAWFDYHGARNLTSHTYNEESAKEVHEAAAPFAVDARRLLESLKETHA